ncbi:hypothetical protein NGRA_0009 [Nosema granulosis]|uniref:Phospholipid/glycerol acyltransferase domain-containing protein n=1 Tax=Nosema granulosis TaxID=83296 RepID=A0A9P6H148_9MICR|nr:hypothetical protein NGRA_0009 [Nosema granulosis]
MQGIKIHRIFNGFLFAIVMMFYFKSIFVIVCWMYLCDKFVTNKALKTRIVRATKRVWLNLTMAALHIYFPQPIYVHYNPIILEKVKNIVISNHLTEYDWLFILNLLYHLGRYDDVCIILKQSLKNIPLVGYGMRFFGFIFLNRQLDKDKQIINEGAERLIHQAKYDLLIFPEGTYIDSFSFPKSRRFASDKKIEVNGKAFNPQNVLVPRTSGFNVLKEELLEDMEGVVDITMLVSPYESFPQEVYSYVDTVLDFKRRLSFVFYIDFVSNKKQIDNPNFLYSVFKEKDELIEKYKASFGKDTFKDLKDFISKTSALGISKEKFRYKVIDMRSRWCTFFYTTFIVADISISYALYKFFRIFI